MKVMKHYIEEMKDSGWRWSHEQLSGILPTKKIPVSDEGQVILGPGGSDKYTVNSQYDKHWTEPRPSWALGLVILGVMALVAAGQVAQYLIGALLFVLLGLFSVGIGLISYQKSYHIYALFCQGIPMQIPPIREWTNKMEIGEALKYTSQEMAMDAKSQLAREALNPNVPWGLIIAAAIAGLGGGAVIGIVAASFHP